MDRSGDTTEDNADLCILCKERFSEKRILEEHLNSHFNELISCTICSTGIARLWDSHIGNKSNTVTATATEDQSQSTKKIRIVRRENYENHHPIVNKKKGDISFATGSLHPPNTKSSSPDDVDPAQPASTPATSTIASSSNQQPTTTIPPYGWLTCSCCSGLVHQNEVQIHMRMHMKFTDPKQGIKTSVDQKSDDNCEKKPVLQSLKTGYNIDNIPGSQKPRYRCNTCGEQFDLRSLKIHRKIHPSFYCVLCGKSFSKEIEFSHHTISQHGIYTHPDAENRDEKDDDHYDHKVFLAGK